MKFSEIQGTSYNPPVKRKIKISINNKLDSFGDFRHRSAPSFNGNP
jgi:hypothetical protein